MPGLLFHVCIFGLCLSFWSTWFVTDVFCYSFTKPARPPPYVVDGCFVLFCFCFLCCFVLFLFLFLFFVSCFCFFVLFFLFFCFFVFVFVFFFCCFCFCFFLSFFLSLWGIFVLFRFFFLSFFLSLWRIWDNLVRKFLG